MKNNRRFTWYRFYALTIKETLYMLRERQTLIAIIITPFLQLAILGFVINADPKHLSTAVVNLDPSPFTSTIIKGMENTGYFDITHYPKTEAEGKYLLQSGKVRYVLTIPANFSREVVRGDKPQILLDGDGVNPLVVLKPFSTAKDLEKTVLNDQLNGPLHYLQPPENPAPFRFTLNPAFNPINSIKISVVPGLVGLTLLSTFLSSLIVSFVQEKELGTMESLLATPATVNEVIFSKLIPLYMLGMVEAVILIYFSHWLFHVPLNGNPIYFLTGTWIYLLTPLLIGLFFSLISKSLLQAAQLIGFVIVPNVMLTGLILPFEGMPKWAQWLGNILPLTHFIRIISNVMIKGGGFRVLMTNLWPILVFIAAMLLLIKFFYRETLD